MYGALIHTLKNHKIIKENGTLNNRFQVRLNSNPMLSQLIVEHTGFLRYSAPLKTRLHCVLQGVVEQPTCKTCGKVVKMRENGKYRYTFPTFCSNKRSARDGMTKQRRVNTNVRKYGVVNSLHRQKD